MTSPLSEGLCPVVEELDPIVLYYCSLGEDYYIVVHKDSNYILSVNIYAPFLQVEIQENFEKSKTDLNGKITSLTSQIDSLNTQLQKEKVTSEINQVESNLY